MRALRIYSQQLSHKLNSSVNYIHHVVHYTPSTYLPCNWKFLPFDYTFIQFPSAQPVPGNHKSQLFFCEFVCL